MKDLFKNVFKNWKTTTGGAVALLTVLVMAMGSLGWVELTTDMKEILILVAIGATGGAAVAASDPDKEKKKDHSETEGD